jgi:hypothetical protein
MDFEQRLQKAIERGQRRGEARAQAEAAREMTEEEVRRLHSQYRLQLSEHIEHCLRRLPNHFPGFQYEMIYGERGWGGACKRDDVRVAGPGQRANLYTRIEITVRPYSPLQVLELTAKGTVHNREVFNRQHYERIVDVDLAKYLETVDGWIVEFVELYAAKV